MWASVPGDDHSIVARFCDSPENAARCSKYLSTGNISSIEGLETINEGDLLTTGDMIYTGEESGAVLELGNGVKILLAQHSALYIDQLGGTLDVPDIHLSLDAGLLTTLSGTALPPEATFEITLLDENLADTQLLSDLDVRVHSPIRVIKGIDNTLPAMIVGHDPETGDVVVSVLGGTATLTDGDSHTEIPPGYLMMVSHKLSPVKLPPVSMTMTMPMTDQDFAVWVSALRFGDGDPSLYPILVPHLTSSDPEPFPIYSVVHSADGHDQAGDTDGGEHHTSIAPDHTTGAQHTQAGDTHTTGDQHTDTHQSTPDQHTETPHSTDSQPPEETDTSHLDGEQSDSGSHDSGGTDSGGEDHIDATQQPHDQ